MPDFQDSQPEIAIQDGEMHPPGFVHTRTIRFYRAKELPPVVVPKFAQYWAQEVSDRLKRNEAILYCQPIIDLCSDVSEPYYEILVRLTKWVGGDRQIIAPGQFFPYILHQPEVMQQLDRWVLQRVVAIAQPGTRYAVNLSAHSLNLDTVGWLKLCMASSDMEPQNLSLEITEAIALNLVEVEPVLDLFKKLGCRVLSDDFGSELSGLTWLYRFPLDGVKVDVSLIRSIAFNQRLQAIAEAIFVIASLIGLDVVCEGIEDGGSLAVLRQIKNNVVGRSPNHKDFRLFGQGYYIQRPQPCC